LAAIQPGDLTIRPYGGFDVIFAAHAKSARDIGM
jgi:hypothetical protein